jgi:hypothetical protein
MITRPTVFILGAGASYNFGYPLGKNLVDIILKNFDPDNEKNSLNLFEGLGFSREEILAFRNELLFSAAPSIDTFLEPRQEEERYLGKLAIAYALIPFEQTAPLFYDGSWYSTLLNKIQPNFDDFEKNKISFITFNYDRSLEHFLMTALKNRFKKTEIEVAEKLKKIPIVHLYGKLANLTWENNGVDNFKRDYNPEITPHLLRKSSKSLKIIYDKVEITDPDFKQARDLIKAASRIYFLGFGFHKDNLERLRIKSILEGRIESPIVEATSYRLPQDLKESIPKLYKIKFPNHDWDINEMFEQKIRL